MAQSVGMGPLLQFTFSVFLLPIGAAFSADRGQVSVALTSALLATAVTVPFAGWLIDRLNTRRLVGGAILLLAAGLALLGLAAQSLASFTTIFVLVGSIAAFHTPLAYTRIISLRFDRNRGLALGLALTGVGVGTILLPQVASRLIEAFGWRGAYVGLAFLLLAVALPGLFLCTRGLVSPEVVPQAEGSGLAPREVMSGGRFWRLLAGIFLAGFAANGTLAHLVPMAKDAGLSTNMAVHLLSLAGIASIAGRLIAGRLADRIWAPLIAAGFFLLAGTGIGLLALHPDSLPKWWLGATLIGLGLGAEADLMALLVSRYFGMQAFGLLFGLVFATFLLASSIGPLAMGLTFANAGSYDPALAASMLGLLAAAALMMSLGRYAYKADRR